VCVCVCVCVCARVCVVLPVFCTGATLRHRLQQREEVGKDRYYINACLHTAP